jgi:hypothetical protein
MRKSQDWYCSRVPSISRVPDGSSAAIADALRPSVVFRIASVLAAALVLAAMVFAFVLKDLPVGLIGSLVVFAACFVVFQILMRKRRKYLTLWMALKRVP